MELTLRSADRDEEISDEVEGWRVVPLGQLGTALIGLTFSPRDVRQDGVLVLRSSNIQDGRLDLRDSLFVVRDIPADMFVVEGDILICARNGSRDLIGKCILLDSRTKGMAFGAFMAVFRSSLNRYLIHQLQSDAFQRQVRSHLGATINQITNASLRSFSVPFPNDPREQVAIAEALSDADELIESLERLIAKKRQIKQGAMQELLTGKRRLPGFTGEWQTRRLGDMVRVRNDRVNPARSPREFCVELEHIESGTGRLIGSTAAPSGASLKAVFGPTDVLFGKLRAYLRKHWLPDRDGVCSTEIWVLSPDEHQLRRRYLYQVIQTDSFIELASTAYGTHMPRSDWKVVSEYQIGLPKTKEQDAIAAVLDDMDAEISALESRLEKARHIKQGMMQQLLTGRIRLVQPESVEAKTVVEVEHA